MNPINSLVYYNHDNCDINTSYLMCAMRAMNEFVILENETGDQTSVKY